ncbi:L-fucose:H+ symporter permease [Botrimarina mediterranea]|uniref:L-fucose-proton symporter n=1 Tax=Botrimarina mediterranea TaxID=2528022 RepID=A0A518KAA6_9BACT|nr:L-fucose:H+ symporter permease [Botrimarina mediterranea]QDV74719.1 L-fucose-proton symporter [Botrimarina mediterranea]
MSQPASSRDKSPVIPPEYFFPFVLVTSLFAMWGFANNVTDPMVAAFKNVLLLSNFESSLVQSAFYGGYCVMAIPAALYIRRFGYKSGVLMGLALYAIGCLLFVPAGRSMLFAAFLAAYFIMTCGLAFLETTANPFILAMGPEHNAPRRLNFAQAFNPMGSLTGMFVAMEFILKKLDETDEAGRRALAEADPSAFTAIQQSDLSVIVIPYVTLGVVVLCALIGFAVIKLPEGESYERGDNRLSAQLGRLFSNPHYLGGVVAQAFYVGAQIMCWTFIIQYGKNELGMSFAEAQKYNIVAMVIFVCSRFICTYLLKFFNPGVLLGALAIGGGLFVLGAIFIQGMVGLYSLVAVSACMSLMFPTIYGIALRGLGDDAKLASAGLICAIGGGCFMPPLQAAIMDGSAVSLGGLTLSATRASFVLPFICFVVVGVYGYWSAGDREKALAHASQSGA